MINRRKNYISLRNDTIYKYYEDANIFSVDFSDGYANHSEEAINNKVLISYDHDDKIVSSISSTITFEKSEEEDVEVAMDDAKKIIALLFRNSSRKIRNGC
ncbi:hypothetical protein C1645_812047 [Glomus cerebriforme]|uniref:DUF2283 domain-containing protein n=1 Tax=Glomus cerebriforme TaxID=658196 RepID=A0A397TM63_9GLOM|nr:hypothetical protein C1645_812047 [Glomus cerebriforme]